MSNIKIGYKARAEARVLSPDEMKRRKAEKSKQKNKRRRPAKSK